MSVQKLYAVYDRKAQHSPGPFPAANHETAIRMFQTLCNDKNTSPGTYPMDFELRYVGRWHDHRPSISLDDHDIGDIIATGAQFLVPAN